VRCLSGKYDLSHLSEHRCPECGREFDPSDPTTIGEPASISWRLWQAFLGLFAVAWVLWLTSFVAFAIVVLSIALRFFIR
jgi:hypothetical protein